MKGRQKKQKSERKTERIVWLVTAEQKQQIDTLANANGKTASALCETIILSILKRSEDLEGARKVLEKETGLKLDLAMVLDKYLNLATANTILNGIKDI